MLGVDLFLLLVGLALIAYWRPIARYQQRQWPQRWRQPSLYGNGILLVAGGLFVCALSIFLLADLLGWNE